MTDPVLKDCVECGGRGPAHSFLCRVGIRETALQHLVSEPFMAAILGSDHSAIRMITRNVERLQAMGQTFLADRQRSVLEAMQAIPAEEVMRCRKCLESADVEDVAGEYTTAQSGLSDRHQTAHDMALFLEQYRMVSGQRDSVVDKDPSGRSYLVRWSAGPKMGGEIQIFGPTWIKIAWNGEAPWMPSSGSRVYDDIFFAQEFLVQAFVARCWEAAEAIPQRPISNRKRSGVA